MTAVQAGGSCPQQALQAVPDQAAFYVVYIREAHPSKNAWQLPVNVKDDVVYASPADASARENLGSIC